MNNSTFKKLIIGIINTLFLSKNTISTLEVKTIFRKEYPDEVCTQDMVSTTMIDIMTNKDLDLGYHDTGIYREYYLTSNPPVIATSNNVATFATAVNDYNTQVAKNIKLATTKTQLVTIMRDRSKGRFFTVNWNRNDGTEAEYNGKVTKKNFMSTLGYINFKTSKGETKQINPKNINKVVLDGITYTIK